jgi:hypothetical protein
MIKQSDVRIDLYREYGVVRNIKLTHIPTGKTVEREGNFIYHEFMEMKMILFKDLQEEVGDYEE